MKIRNTLKKMNKTHNITSRRIQPKNSKRKCYFQLSPMGSRDRKTSGQGYPGKTSQAWWWQIPAIPAT